MDGCCGGSVMPKIRENKDFGIQEWRVFVYTELAGTWIWGRPDAESLHRRGKE